MIKNRDSREYRSFVIKKIYMLFYFVYSIFIPIKLTSISGRTGLILYITGFIFYIFAWKVIVVTGKGEIFKTGPFAHSRHPVYLSSAVMFLGAGFVSGSLFFLFLSIITGITHMHNACDEEKRCLEVFGDEYLTYSNKTPRWIGFRR